jgi:hypothetical protein
VDIYKRGYTGNEVITLVGAANPFEYEEEDSEDTLNAVIRYRTGYLRVIENNYGDLDELYPLLNTDRYIEFYYGNDLDFNGFIQAQEFENPWNAGPREVEIPVISPLGLAAHTTIDWTQYNPPRWLSIESMINNMLAALEGGYEGYYFPQIISLVYPITVYSYICSLTFCPWGNDYSKNTDLPDGIFDPKTVEDALTNVCTWMGLILHDLPGYVMFQRLDYNDQYLKRRDVDNPYYQPLVTDITLTASVASNKSSSSRIIPLSKIEVRFAGEIDIPTVDFARCRGFERGCAVEDHEFCTNRPVVADFTGDYTIYAGVNSDGQISKGVICLGAYGSGGLQESIMFRPDSEWSPTQTVAIYTFYEWNGVAARLFFSFRYGEGLDSLNNPEPERISVVLKTGNYYYDGQTKNWTTEPSTASAWWTDGRNYCEMGFIVNHELTTQPLTVEFHSEGNSDDYIYTISNIGLKLFSKAADQYLNRNFYDVDFDIEGSPSIVDGSVERGYSTRCYSLNRIRVNEHYIIGATWNEVVEAEPEYPYLLQSQDRLQVDVKMPRPDYRSVYLDRLILWGSTDKWRTIALGFTPWNDTYKLTLHHSVTFDTN